MEQHVVMEGAQGEGHAAIGRRALGARAQLAKSGEPDHVGAGLPRPRRDPIDQVAGERFVHPGAIESMRRGEPFVHPGDSGV